MSVSTLAKPTCNRSQVGARTLPVAGIIPFSATDWPGNITITIFTQGCPLRCVYCHNPNLQAFGAGSHDFAEALALAVDRRSRQGGSPPYLIIPNCSYGADIGTPMTSPPPTSRVLPRPASAGGH